MGQELRPRQPAEPCQSRALSNDPLLRDTEASERTGVSSTPFLGPRDTPGWIRRPRVHQGLGRPPRAFLASSGPRPNIRVSCPWDGSRAHTPWDVRSPVRVDDAPRSSPARPAERHKETRVAEPWLPGSRAGMRVGSVGQLQCQNAPWAPAGAPTFRGPSTDARGFALPQRPAAAPPPCPEGLADADPGTVPCIGPQRNPIEHDF